MQSYPYLIVALLLVMTWTLVLAFELDLRVGAIGSVGILFALAGFLAWQWFRRSQPAQKRKAPDQEDKLRLTEDDLVFTNIEQATQRIKTAHELLSAHNDSRFYDARYALPWYLVIGPESAGKSTLIKNSGLRFGHTSLTKGDATPQNVLNTDHLHLWLGDEAVIADTAGRYTSQADALEEWKKLLQTFRRLRPHRSLEAIIVALDLEDFQSKNAEQLKELAEQVRLQIQLVNTTLKSNHPIYIVLTHADKLPSFQAFSERLEVDERQRPWGFKLNPLLPDQDLKSLVRTDLSDLARLLHERCMQEVMRETKAETAQALHQFSRGLTKLARPISTFVGTLGSQLRTQDPLRLRGLHLTSISTQRDVPSRAPKPRVVQGHLSTAMHHRASVSQLFLPRYFRSVILPDVGLARPGRKMRQQIARRNRTLGVCGFVGALGLCSLPLISAGKNRDLQSDLEGVIRDAKSFYQGGSKHQKLLPPKLWQDSAALDEQLASVKSSYQLSHRFGMFQGDKLADASKSLFLGLTIEHGIAPMLRRDELVLSRLSGHPGALSFPQVQALRNSLYRYLFLTSGPQDRKPELEGEVRDRLIELMASLWLEEQRFTDLEHARSVATRFVEHLRQDPSLAQARQQGVVKLAQSRLFRDDPVLADAKGLIESINQARPAMELKDLVNPRVMDNGKRVIRPAFTRRVWEQELRKGFQTLIETYDIDEWLLGQFSADASSRKSERLARVHDYYFRAYQREWRSFLDAIDLSTPSYEEEFIVNLDDLSHAAHPPLYALATAVDWNTQLAMKATSLKDKALDKLKQVSPKAQRAAEQAKRLVGAPQDNGDAQRYMTADQLRLAFSGFVRFGVSQAPSGAAGQPKLPGQAAQAQATSGPGPDLTRYLGYVRSLRGLLVAQQYGQNDPGSNQHKIAALASQVQTLAREQPDSWRNWFERILYTPFRYATTTQQSQQERALEKQWCQLRQEIESKAFSRYPFRRNSNQDVNLVELTELLHPKTGSLWAFAQEHLADLTQRQGFRFERRQSRRASHRPLNREVVNFLNAAASLSEMLYPPGQNQPQMSFRVEAKPQSGIERTSFQVNEQQYTYANGSEHQQSMTWPGQGQDKSAQLQARHAHGEFNLRKQGPWALFRLIEEGSVLQQGPASSVVVVWKTGLASAHQVTLYFTPDHAPSPLQSGRNQPFLHAFRRNSLKVPDGLLVGSRKCN